MKNQLASIIYLLLPFSSTVIFFQNWFGISFKSDLGLSLLLGGWLLSITALILYVLHIRKNDRVRRENKSLWILLFLVGNPIGEIVYWFRYMRKPAA